MAMNSDLIEHLSGGLTTLSRCWLLERRDGWKAGFTDHDGDLTFDGVTFKANTGLTSTAVMQTTGLSIDNTEALGILTDASVREADIQSGRFDGAKVEAWLVNWMDTNQRELQFRGHLGEITRSGGAFRAELLGLSEALNQPQGRAYMKTCTEGLQGVDLNDLTFSAEVEVEANDGDITFYLDGAGQYPERWFERGRLEVISGKGAGLIGVIKNDRVVDGKRVVELWQELRAGITVGDQVRVVAGFDGTAKTCAEKFDDMVNFRGFPSIPGEGRLLSIPVKGTKVDTSTGGAK